MKKRNDTRNLTSVLGCLVLAGALPASADESVITPVSAVASSEFNATNGAASNLLGPGFTTLDPIETSTHVNSSWNQSNHWFSSAAGKATPHVDFDLGGTFTVGVAHIWNYNGTGGGVPGDLTWGVNDFTLIFSQDATFGNGDDTSQSFTGMSQAPGTNDYTGEHFALTPVGGVTNIRLQVDTPIGGSFTGLSEVRFGGVVGPPIPFAITEIEYDPDAVDGPTVTLTWRNSGAATYIAWLSRDLIDWDEDLDDSVTAEDDDRPADAEHITVTFPLEGDRADAEELFFRIEEG